MTIILPSHGEEGWDTDLNALLLDFDNRVIALEDAIPLQPVMSVNSDPGPNVVLSLDDIADVSAQPVIIDRDTSEIISQPDQGDVVQWDQATGLWVTGRPEVVASHNHDERYAPIGWTPPFFVPGFVYDSGSESIPGNLPLNCIIFDIANPAAVVVTANASSTLKKPVQVTGLNHSAVTQTTATLTWTAVTTTTPSGGAAATGYKIYKSGVLYRTVGAVTSANLTGLTPGASLSFTVSAINPDGEGAQSTATTFTMAAASVVPGAPTSLHTTAVTETTVDLAWTDGTEDPYAPTTSYNIYEISSVSPIATVAAPTLTAHIVGLTGSTDYEFTVKGVNSVGESSASTALDVTTDTVTSSGETIRTDQVLDYWGINAKISYGPGTTYGDNTVSTWANTDQVVSDIIAAGARIWREKVALTGSAQGRQRHAMPTLAAAGVRWHSTIGVLSDVKTDSEASVRTWATNTVRDALAEFAGYYLTNAPIPGKMESVLYSVGGPNEVDNSALNGANWARNAYLLQHELWKQMRLGSIVPSYVTLFANVIILAPSIRSNILTQPSLATAMAANITGEGFIRDWCDRINPHKYQAGVCATQGEIQESIDAWAPIRGSKTMATDFTECGYNSMNYDNDSNYIGGGVNHTGAPKVPPWVMGVYVPKALASFAKAGCGYYIHELLDDADPPTTFNIQSHFGMIGMQGSTTATSPPSGWLPKPSWYAMRRMANLLYDRTSPTVAPSFTPTDLPHTISGVSGAGVNFQKLVTQKANGRWYMLIWREVDVFQNSETSYGTDLTVANVNVNITVPQARTYNTFKPNDATAGSPNGTTAATCTATPSESGTVTAGGTFTIPLAGNLKIIEIY